MTEEMRNTLSGILENTVEPITGLSLADLGVVMGIRYNAISEKFSVYLNRERMALITGTFFFMTQQVQLEELFSQALEKAFPGCGIRYHYIPGRKNRHHRLTG